MKNSFYFFIILSVLFCSPLKAYSDCYTGYACSLDELIKKEQLQTKQNIEFIQNYFKQTNISENFAGKQTASQNYKDMFLFNYMIF